MSEIQGQMGLYFRQKISLNHSLYKFFNINKMVKASQKWPKSGLFWTLARCPKPRLVPISDMHIRIYFLYVY